MFYPIVTLVLFSTGLFKRMKKKKKPILSTPANFILSRFGIVKLTHPEHFFFFFQVPVGWYLTFVLKMTLLDWSNV